MPTTSGTRIGPIRALRIVWAGADLDRYRSEAAARLETACRETIMSCEIDDPDHVADRIVGTVVQKAIMRHAGACRDATRDWRSWTEQSFREVGYAAGRIALAEMVLARAPAFASTIGCRVDEICLTLVHRTLEELERRCDRVAPPYMEGAMEALWRFLEDMTDPHARPSPTSSRLGQRLAGLSRAGSRASSSAV